MSDSPPNPPPGPDGPEPQDPSPAVTPPPPIDGPPATQSMPAHPPTEPFAQPPTTPPPDTGPPPTQPVPSSGPGAPVLIALGVLLLVIVGAGAFFLLRDGDDDTSGNLTAAEGNEEGDGEDPARDPVVTEPPPTTDPLPTTVPPSTAPPTTVAPTTTQPANDPVEPGAGSPEDPIRAVFDAMLAGDCPRMVDQFTEAAQEQEGGRGAMISDCEQSIGDMEGMGFDVAEMIGLIETSVSSQDGNRAVVIVSYNDPDGFADDDELEVVLVDGVWKIADFD